MTFIGKMYSFCLLGNAALTVFGTEDPRICEHCSKMDTRERLTIAELELLHAEDEQAEPHTLEIDHITIFCSVA